MVMRGFKLVIIKKINLKFDQLNYLFQNTIANKISFVCCFKIIDCSSHWNQSKENILNFYFLFMRTIFWGYLEEWW